jgi:hypothetical protein
MRRAIAAAALLAAAGCPRHAEVIPLIPISPKAASRLDWLARRTGTHPQSAAARVHVMKAGEELGGPDVLGRPGDLVLENDEVVFVIEQLGAGVGFAQSGGDVIDAADARARRDELGQMFTYFGRFPRQGVYDQLTSGAEADGSRAWVEARGRELHERSVAVTTRYALNAPDRALLLETTVQNTGSSEVTLPGLGDAIEWGGAEKTAPGKAPGFTGLSRGPYLGGVGRFVSYAVASTDGDIDAVSGRSWSDTTQRADVKLAPGASEKYARILLVGQRPDTSSLVGELALAAGAPVGEAQALLPEAGALPRGFLLGLRPEGGGESLTLAPPFDAQVPVGKYRLVDVAGRAIEGQGTIDVAAGAVARFAVGPPPVGSLDVRCTGQGEAPMPCKVSFEGVAPTPSPAFGSGVVAGPAGNQATTATGEVHVDLAAGSYHVIASRGPEYALASIDLTLAAGEHAARTLSPAHVVDTRGYLACDFHQHTMRGLDSAVGSRDRVVSNVAEGVEVAVASEHNVVSDLESIVQELGMDREMVSIAGDELTSDALQSPWGHANAFPLAPDPAKPRGGAPVIAERNARDVFDEVRSRFGDVVVQINHPRSGKTGYFDLLGFDGPSGLGAAPGYDPAFDALEVWNGRNVDARARVLSDFLALLHAGRPVTPTANTDTHAIVAQEAGYPRTYVRVSDEGHFDTWDSARNADLVRGIKVLRDVVLTNGPMLRVTANGAPIGGTTQGPLVHVAVDVESAPWVVVDEVALVRASGSRIARPVVAKTVGSVLRASVSFDVTATTDDAFVVIASGSRPLSPVLAKTAPDPAENKDILPWAMTGAIWIDARTKPGSRSR